MLLPSVAPSYLLRPSMGLVLSRIHCIPQNDVAHLILRNAASYSPCSLQSLLPTTLFTSLLQSLFNGLVWSNVYVPVTESLEVAEDSGFTVR
jgi:hypothetical protein